MPSVIEPHNAASARHSVAASRPTSEPRRRRSRHALRAVTRSTSASAVRTTAKIVRGIPYNRDIEPLARILGLRHLLAHEALHRDHARDRRGGDRPLLLYV